MPHHRLWSPITILDQSMLHRLRFLHRLLMVLMAPRATAGNVRRLPLVEPDIFVLNLLPPGGRQPPIGLRGPHGPSRLRGRAGMGSGLASLRIMAHPLGFNIIGDLLSELFSPEARRPNVWLFCCHWGWCRRSASILVHLRRNAAAVALCYCAEFVWLNRC